MRTTSSGRLSRRHFIAAAAAFGAVPAWASARRRSGPQPTERRDLFPQGVGSGDPDAHSVLLWTRRPYGRIDRAELKVEVAEDPHFDHVIATAGATILPAADWTCRILVGNLKPASTYWYRFIDSDGNASRTGRTRTAPSDSDLRPVRFAFVSCHSINTGASNAFRRMIHDDEQAPTGAGLDFVLHLGDFVYEVVWYPEDNPVPYCGRRLRDTVRFPHGERLDWGKYGIIHTPVTLEDYRTLYRAHLDDPELQDARARWPFISVWDNEEFTDLSWQSMRVVNGTSIPSQTRKVAANQAWFEYQPARIVKASGPSLEAFEAPAVSDVMPSRFDRDGFGLEPNNRTAVDSLTIYRALRFGANVELLLTDLFSYRSEPPRNHPLYKTMADERIPNVYPEEALTILDAGRDYGAGAGGPPTEIRFGDRTAPNPRRDSPPDSLLGSRQKAWFLDRLKTSTVPWKIWGHSQGNLIERLDLENLPADMKNPWPGARYAAAGDAIHELRDICDAVRSAGVIGFATVSGNRHSFWAGYSAPALPPAEPFRPVGVNFITGAISSSSAGEYYAWLKPADRPLGQLMVTDRPGGVQEPTLNLLYRHGFKAAAEYAASGDLARARALANPDLAPHLRFLDLGGNGYAVVTAAPDALDCEFVCIPTPRERAPTPDGGPIRYRVVHRAALWKAGEQPVLEQRVIEGDPKLSV